MHWQVFFSADNLCGLLAWLFYLSPASWFSLSSPYIASCSSLIWLRNVWGLWQVYEILGLLHVNIVLPEDSLRLHKVQESICCSGKGQTRCSFRNDPFQKHNNFRNKLAIETGRRKSELQWNNVYIKKMDNWKKGRYIYLCFLCPYNVYHIKTRSETNYPGMTVDYENLPLGLFTDTHL